MRLIRERDGSVYDRRHGSHVACAAMSGDTRYLKLHSQVRNLG